MGYDATAYTVIGVVVKIGDIRTKHRRDVCDCGKAIKDIDAKYCPDCGHKITSKKLWFNKYESCSDFEKEIGLELFATGCENYRDDDEAVLGIELGRADQGEIACVCQNLAQIENILSVVIENLNKLGLLDSETVGIHTLIYESY